VKTSTGRTITLSVQGTDKFDHVKGQLQALLGTPLERQCPFFCADMMAGEMTLNSCRIRNESMIEAHGLAGLGRASTGTPAMPATTPAPAPATFQLHCVLAKPGGGFTRHILVVAVNDRIQTVMRLLQDEVGIPAEQLEMS
jgi:hypothetical protein